MKPLRSVVAVIASGFLLPLVVSSSGCKKDEPPPPLPSAAPAATPTPTAALELAPEPTPAESAAPEAKKGGGAPAPGLMNCCKALLQNAASAPPPNNLYMTQAGQLCTAMVQAGQGSGAVLSAVAGKLGGANMPTACR